MTNALVRLDENFRIDRLVPTLGLLAVSATSLIVAPIFAAGSEIAALSLFALTGVFFIHQFGIRGGPLAVGFLITATLVAVIGIPMARGLTLAVGGIVVAGFMAFYSTWIQDIHTGRDHRRSVAGDLETAVRMSHEGEEEFVQKTEKHEKRLQTWTSLVGVVHECSSTLKFDQLAEAVLATVEALFPEARASLWLSAAPPRADARSAAVVRPASQPASQGRRYQRRTYDLLVPCPDGLDLVAGQSRQNILVVDRDKDSRFQSAESRFSGRSALVCPLIEEGNIYGNLRVVSEQPERFDHDDMVILSHIASVFSMSASNVRLYERTEELALTDGQTGLYKRYYYEKRFSEECKRALRKSNNLSVILVDIDLFKRVNDTYGHSVGDRVLQAVGRVIREVDWGGPLPCRWGGEEFLVALPDATRPQAKARAEDIAGKIKAIAFQGEPAEGAPKGGPAPTFRVTVSVGVASFPADTGDPEQLFQISDRRLYRAKNTGRDQVVDHD